MASRGKNFTEKEKVKLLELIQKYKHIIGNKCTNAVITEKKRRAWENLTAEYNSVAEQPRSSKQLNTAYLNLRRSTRQNIANENVKKCLEELKQSTSGDEEHLDKVKNCLEELKQTASGNEEHLDKLCTPKQEIELHNVLIQLKKDIAEKKGTMATGGGTYAPLLTDVGAQMLPVIKDKVQPLPNCYDSASDYFKNNEVADCEMEVSQSSNSCDGFDSTDKINNVQESDCKTKRKILHKRKGNRIGNENLKKQYYLKKLECAIIEKKTRMIEYKTALKKSKILDLQLRKKQKELEDFH